jgi:L-ascorbate metabolism protein UlaG (beta-lactamase superfamily)
MNSSFDEIKGVLPGNDRRKFLAQLASLGLASPAVLGMGQTAVNNQASQSATQPQPPKPASQVTDDPGTWLLTLGGPDGPHPAFVSNSRRLFAAPELLDAPNEWIDRSLQWIDYILRTFPPGLVEIPVRRAALFRLDEILHIESAARKPLVQDYYRMRMEHAVAEIERTKVTQGMRIWRLYNHGALIRTPTVSFTFDIVPGVLTRGPAGPVPSAFTVPDALLQRLVAQSDATFISHKHFDHANVDVAKMFLAAGKPVIAPERLFANEPQVSNALTVPERSTDLVHEIAIQGGAKTLKVVVYPGHQGKPVLDNVHLVTSPDGYTVVHTGDQSGDEGPGTDFDWLAQIGHYHQVDVLLPNGWTNDLHRVVRGIDPQLVIPGHENEMSHEVAHREEYTQDYERMFGLHYPFIVMTWGESFLYQRAADLIGVLPDEN